MAVTVTELTVDPDHLIDDWVLVRRETDRELNPGDPPYPAAELKTEVFVPRTHARYRAWIAHLDGEPAGEAILGISTDDANAHLAEIEWLAVRPDLRRRGIATALARATLDGAADEQRSTVLAWVPTEHHSDAGSWCRRLGLTPATSERCSRVRVADLDRHLLQSWADDAVGPALGYRLVQYQDHCPDEHREALVAANAAMLDMPTDELDWTVPSFGLADLVAREKEYDAKSCTVAGTLALAPDGSAAGFSEIIVSRHRPQLAHQGDTGVVPAHRGHGLGRWLKAANLAWAEKVSPGFEVIETYNAESNPWMLAINVAMGFRPHIGYVGFQGDRESIQNALG